MDSEEFSLFLSIIKIITVDYCIDESFELREKKIDRDRNCNAFVVNIVYCCSCFWPMKKM